MSGVWDLNIFPKQIRKSNTLQIRNAKKSLRIEATAASPSLSVDPVLIPKYEATVLMRSLEETEGTIERVEIL